MTRNLAAHLQCLEEQLLQPAIRSKPEAVAALLTDDFREFGSSGRVYTKPEILILLAQEDPHPIAVAELHCHQLSPESALLRYRSTTPNGSALRSSLWVLRDSRWQMLFHQGTKIPPSASNTPLNQPSSR